MMRSLIRLIGEATGYRLQFAAMMGVEMVDLMRLSKPPRFLHGAARRLVLPLRLSTSVPWLRDILKVQTPLTLSTLVFDEFFSNC